MRTTKTVSISLAPEQYKIAERLAKKQSRTMSELFREGLRRLEEEDTRRRGGINTDLLAALRAVQEEARRTGLDKMSMREIDAEVQAYRREQRAKGKSKRPAK